MCGIFRFGHLSLRSTRHLSASFWWSLCSEGFIVLPRVIPKGFTLQTRYIELGSPSWVLLNPHLEVPSFLTFPGQYFIGSVASGRALFAQRSSHCPVYSTRFHSPTPSLRVLILLLLGSLSPFLWSESIRPCPITPFHGSGVIYSCPLSLFSSLPKERHHAASRFFHAPFMFRAFLANSDGHSFNKLFSLLIYFV